MMPRAFRSVCAWLAPLTFAAIGSGCSSPPSQLYVLSSVPPARPAQAATSPKVTAGYGSSRPAGAKTAAPIVGVAVSVPEYLDRTNIVQRTSANELKPDYSAQWAESLATTSTRAVGENLAAMLPSDDIVVQSARAPRNMDYQVNLDLTRFESDAEGRSMLAGRWSISDADGNERASGRVQRAEPAGGAGYDAMAAAMSRNLAAVSTDIATALQNVSAASAQTATAPHSSSSARREKR